jgi:hypothetical protein
VAEVEIERSDFTFHMRLEGEITKIDLDKIKEALKSISEKHISRTMWLSSRGGEVDAALEIGELVRENNFYTFVNSGSVCASACVFVLAAGVFRDVQEGGIVVIHRPAAKAEHFVHLSRSEYEKVLLRIKDYLSRMGVSDRLYEQMMKVAFHETRVLSQAELSRFGLNGYDPYFQERQRAEDIITLGVDYVKRRDVWIMRMRQWCAWSRETPDQCFHKFNQIEPYPKSLDPSAPDFSRYGVPLERK